ncbi:MAG: DUF2071 domain-containing protein [Anaerolineae bacterium]
MARPWVMAQAWHDVLLMHWPLPAAALEPRLPAGLALDRYEGQAWLGIVVLRMDGVRLRGLPAVPGLSALAQVNVRTYVVGHGRPGVYFFHLYASSRLATLGARLVFSLPYQAARVSVRGADGGVRYRCRREGRDGPDAALEAICRPAAAAFEPAPGSLAAWLTERYRLFTPTPGGDLRRTEIEHEPWSLHETQIDITDNTLAALEGLSLPSGPPLAHYARRMETRFWLPQQA